MKPVSKELETKLWRRRTSENLSAIDRERNIVQRHRDHQRSAPIGNRVDVRVDVHVDVRVDVCVDDDVRIDGR